MPLWIDQERLHNPERLQALRSLGLLDTAAHEDFDRITRLALTALNVPISLISLVEPQREYVLSGQGLPERQSLVAAPGTSFDYLGKYAISSNDVTNIGDVWHSAGLIRSPALEALNIQAYLSAPLRDPEGYVLVAVCVMDHHPRTWTPREIATISQLADLANREIREPPTRRIVPVVRKGGSPASLETATVALHDETGDRLGYVDIHRDAAVIQSQKMESLGALAGGVAHDFNNLLTAILGSTGILRSTPTELSASDVESLDSIEQAAQMAAEITGNLLNFARGEHSRLAEVDLRTEVATALRLAQFKVPTTVEVVCGLPDNPVVVEGDASQLQQVVLNIAINACYVMESGGTLTVTLEEGETNAVLSIADTGPGMDKATCDRIFEPFFTTKPRGVGTGLGLASAHGIVVGHRGTINVVSSPGEGTVFTVRLPLVDSAHAPAEPVLPPVRRGAILVVDDDEVVRRTAVSMLGHIGFVADAAPTGEAAVKMVRETPERWAAVLLDLVLPQASGSETFRELMAIKPDLCVIVASGYSPDRFLSDDERREVDAFLPKPFTLERLQSTLAGIGLLPAERSAG